MTSFGNDTLSGGVPLSAADGSSESSLVSLNNNSVDNIGNDASTIIHMLQDVLAEQRELKAQHQELKAQNAKLLQKLDVISKFSAQIVLALPPSPAQVEASQSLVYQLTGRHGFQELALAKLSIVLEKHCPQQDLFNSGFPIREVMRLAGFHQIRLWSCVCRQWLNECQALQHHHLVNCGGRDIGVIIFGKTQHREEYKGLYLRWSRCLNGFSVFKKHTPVKTKNIYLYRTPKRWYVGSKLGSPSGMLRTSSPRGQPVGEHWMQASSQDGWLPAPELFCRWMDERDTTLLESSVCSVLETSQDTST